MMSMFYRDGLTIMVMTGKAEWEGEGIRFSEDGCLQVGGDWIEALVDGAVVARGCAVLVGAPAGSLVEFRPMKPSRSDFSADEIEAARKSKTVSVVSQEEFDDGPFVFDGTLDAVIASLHEIREKVPERYRKAARCEIKGEQEYGNPRAVIAITYSRPETDEEVSERLRSELLRKESKEREERAALEMLQKKYGTG